jgi:hypothetical protein
MYIVQWQAEEGKLLNIHTVVLFFKLIIPFYKDRRMFE